MRRAATLLLFALTASCSNPGGGEPGPTPDAARDVAQDAARDASAVDAADAAVPDIGPAREDDRVYSYANGCFTVSAAAPDGGEVTHLREAGGGWSWAPSADDATPIHMRASDLATYLLYDPDRHYVVSLEGGPLERVDRFLSDVLVIDDDYLPGAPWVVEGPPRDGERFQLRHLKTDQYLTAQGGLSPFMRDAALIAFTPAEGCAEFPELTLDAQGTPSRTTFDDGDLYGAVDTHAHLMSNFAFGGGGIFHGAAYHPFGVEHALADCSTYHGEMGRKDLMGYGFDQGGELDQTELIQSLINGETPEDNHATDGYPSFTDWPNAPGSSTHQTQYYRWLERAHLGGLRLYIQHATSNRVICDLIVGSDVQKARYGCEDMVAADRIIAETKKLERYIDAQHGGPGQGWFRIVYSPAQARQIIEQGKMAVVLGLEVSHLFDCYLSPPAGVQKCTEDDVVARLDEYWDKGVRVIFPVHKYDNAFSAGDGSRELIEIGNFVQSGHWSNFTDDCPDVPTSFDKGSVSIGGLNEPRDVYDSSPPANVARFPVDPIGTLIRFTDRLLGGPISGDYCQNAGMTPLGEFLMLELMKRGVVIEVDHFPRRSYVRAFELLRANDYPATGTHGNTNRGELFGLGGISKFGVGRCSDPDEPGGRLRSLRNDLTEIRDAGGYPAEGFGFDLNGFAGALGPRFGEGSPCRDQVLPVTYPFTSHGGSITFSQPRLGERIVDYNTEGFVHIGMFPEMIEDAIHDGATDQEIESIFRSAEGYIRMWEKAEARGAAIAAE